ncbi:hypothetical protein EDD72_101259 [Tepidibacillus fermentans]|uniref:Reverse transcriptase (RNA-dependent DNA polymerase) n=1 Tax=Tepidibacillus fermentans TaxID=1281767 RepID=A0A4R3KLW6_9BACI|nr:hypothetical protein EDD72_101259 [Tepidibacillus fermentans]
MPTASLIKRIASELNHLALWGNAYGQGCPPRGGSLSPLLANILLDEVDKELGKRGLSLCCLLMIVISTIKVKRLATE